MWRQEGKNPRCTEVFDFLATLFDTTTRRVNAKSEFKDLKLSKASDWESFKKKFVRLANEISLPQANRKEEMYDKLTANLKSQVWRDNADSRVTFPEFCEILENYTQLQTEQYNSLSKRQAASLGGSRRT